MTPFFRMATALVAVSMVLAGCGQRPAARSQLGSERDLAGLQTAPPVAASLRPPTRAPAVTFAVWSKGLLPSAVVRAADRTEGIIAAGLVAPRPARVAVGKRSLTLSTIAIDVGPIEREPSLDAVARALGRGDVAINAATARKRGLRVGSFLTLKRAGMRVRVGALFASNALFGYELAIAMNRAPAEWLQRPRALVVAVRPASVNEATRALVRAAGGSDAVIRPLQEEADPGTVLPDATIKHLFGSFPYVRGPGDSIIPDERWVRAAIVDWRVPVIGWVRCHRNIVPQLWYAMDEIRRLGLSKSIETYDGCYVPRFVRGDDTKLSAHAYGIAVDFNAATNGMGAAPTIDPRLVRVMKRWGFAWGGDFSRPDGMHFEFVRYVRPGR